MLNILSFLQQSFNINNEQCCVSEYVSVLQRLINVTSLARWRSALDATFNHLCPQPPQTSPHRALLNFMTAQICNSHFLYYKGHPVMSFSFFVNVQYFHFSEAWLILRWTYQGAANLIRAKMHKVLLPAQINTGYTVYLEKTLLQWYNKVLLIAMILIEGIIQDCWRGVLC